MLSRNGSATAAPAARSISRRDSAFFVMIMTPISSSGTARSRRCHERATTTDSRRPRRRARSCARPADRTPRAAAESIAQQLFGHRRDELLASGQQDRAQAGRALEAAAVDQRARGVDRAVAFGGRPPAAHRVEVLQREPERIHRRVAARARRVAAVLLEPRAHRDEPPALVLVRSASATSGGGGGGGAPSKLPSTHLPRSTGEVRFGYEVTVSRLAWPSSPLRWSWAAPSVTRRNRSP